MVKDANTTTDTNANITSDNSNNTTSNTNNINTRAEKPRCAHRSAHIGNRKDAQLARICGSGYTHRCA